MNKNKKSVVKGVVAAASVAGSIVTVNALATKLTKTLIYRHHKEDDLPSILESRFNSKNVYIKNNQGVKLRGIIIEEEGANQTLVILHPFGLEAKDMSLYVPFFKNHLEKTNILLVDACAHGQSDGYIRGFGVKDVQDLQEWNRYLLDRYGNTHQIILYGKEMGANTILNVSSKHCLKNVKAIISDGAYTSPYDILTYRLMKDYYVPKYPAITLLTIKIKKAIHLNIKESTTSLVKHNDIPTLYIHMKDDDFVPLKMVYPLYNANRGDKVLFVLKEERYLYDLDVKDEYRKTFTDFINKYAK